MENDASMMKKKGEEDRAINSVSIPHLHGILMDANNNNVELANQRTYFCWLTPFVILLAFLILLLDLLIYLFSVFCTPSQ